MDLSYMWSLCGDNGSIKLMTVESNHRLKSIKDGRSGPRWSQLPRIHQLDDYYLRAIDKHSRWQIVICLKCVVLKASLVRTQTYLWNNIVKLSLAEKLWQCHHISSPYIIISTNELSHKQLTPNSPCISWGPTYPPTLPFTVHNPENAPRVQCTIDDAIMVAIGNAQCKRSIQTTCT